MHFPPAALIGCLTTVVAFKRSFKRNMSDNCRRYLNQILMLWNSSKENVQKRWKVAMVKFALHEYFSWKYAKQCKKHFLSFRNKWLRHYKKWLLKTLRSQYWLLIYIFSNKYGNFWTSKYILEVTMATIRSIQTLNTNPGNWIVLVAINSIFWEMLFWRSISVVNVQRCIIKWFRSILLIFRWKIIKQMPTWW